jgi:hypothetical protein
MTSQRIVLFALQSMKAVNVAGGVGHYSSASFVPKIFTGVCVKSCVGTIS